VSQCSLNSRLSLHGSNVTALSRYLSAQPVTVLSQCYINSELTFMGECGTWPQGTCRQAGLSLWSPGGAKARGEHCDGVGVAALVHQRTPRTRNRKRPRPELTVGVYSNSDLPTYCHCQLGLHCGDTKHHISIFWNASSAQGPPALFPLERNSGSAQSSCSRRLGAPFSQSWCASFLGSMLVRSSASSRCWAWLSTEAHRRTPAPAAPWSMWSHDRTPHPSTLWEH